MIRVDLGFHQITQHKVTGRTKCMKFELQVE